MGFHVVAARRTVIQPHPLKNLLKMVTKKGKQSVKGRSKKPAAAPLAAKPAAEKPKVVNPLLEKRPRNFGIGQDIQPKRDLSHFIKYPKYIRIQRQRAVLMKRLKVPPPIHQFKSRLDSSKAKELFKLLNKYKPETKRAKIERLRKRAEARAEGKEDVPTKKKPAVRMGVNTVTTLIEQKKAKLVVIACDVNPIEIVLHLPALCRKQGIPYCIVGDKGRLGQVVKRKTVTCLAVCDVESNDKTAFSKLVEAIKVSYNDRFDDIRRQWGGGVLSAKSRAQIATIEKAKAKELKR